MPSIYLLVSIGSKNNVVSKRNYFTKKKKKKKSERNKNFFPGLVKDAARPAYWVPDQDIHSCCECQREFSPRLSIHHCRACGQGVCDDCSQERRPVPSRGWDHPVRVCNGCNQKAGEL